MAKINKTQCLLLRYSLSSKEARYKIDNEEKKKKGKDFYVIQSSLGTQRLWLKLGFNPTLFSYFHLDIT